MKTKLILMLKSSSLFYKFYLYVGSALMSILSFFIRIDKKMILINSFSGKKYDDSPKVIFEEMIKDSRFKEYRFIWAFYHPQKFDLPAGEKIKIDSLKYYYYTLKAGCWITNSGIERALRYKNKKTFYLNTLHGTPIKKKGDDIEKSKRYLDGGHALKWKIDVICAQGEYDAQIYSKAFNNVGYSKVLKCGLPRNDILANYTIDMQADICRKMGLPKDKKIILYAPTFREFYKDNQMRVVLNPPIDFNKWEKQLGDEYIFLFRAHYEVAEILNIKPNKFIYDVSDYGCLNDLMIVSDMLISDYSSTYFDYSIMAKPMLCFAYDYDLYMQNRGMYIDIKKELPCEIAYDEDTLLAQIAALDYEKASLKTARFRDRYIESYGNAAHFCIEKIWDAIGGR